METSYDWILSQIPRIHGLRPSTNRHRPDREDEIETDAHDLIVHLGVAPDRHFVTIEHRAPRWGYSNSISDNRDEMMPVRNVDATDDAVDRGFVGDEWNVTEMIDGKEQIATKLNIQAVCATLRRDAGFEIELSTNPGNLPCGASYFASLASAERNRKLGRKAAHVVWVHLPECVGKVKRRLTTAGRITRTRRLSSLASSIRSCGSWRS